MNARVDPTKFEMRDYRVVGGDLTQRLELTDGSVIELKVIIQGIMKTGNDAGTGLPLYASSTATFVRLVKEGPGTRTAPAVRADTPPGFG